MIIKKQTKNNIQAYLAHQAGVIILSYHHHCPCQISSWEHALMLGARLSPIEPTKTDPALMEYLQSRLTRGGRSRAPHPWCRHLHLYWGPRARARATWGRGQCPYCREPTPAQSWIRRSCPCCWVAGGHARTTRVLDGEGVGSAHVVESLRRMWGEVREKKD